eukprot:765556-Hanusia_phi.AAC.1
MHEQALRGDKNGRIGKMVVAWNGTEEEVTSGLTVGGSQARTLHDLIAGLLQDSLPRSQFAEPPMASR